MTFTDSEGEYGDENFGEPPSDEAFGLPPYRERPHPIPTDPVNLIGQPPYFENANWITDFFARFFNHPDPELIPYAPGRLPQPGDLENLPPGAYNDPIEMDPETGRLYRNTPGGPEYLNDGTIPLPQPNPQNYTHGDVPPFSMPDRNGPSMQEMLDAIGRPISYPSDPDSVSPQLIGGVGPLPWWAWAGALVGTGLYSLYYYSQRDRQPPIPDTSLPNLTPVPVEGPYALPPVQDTTTPTPTPQNYSPPSYESTPSPPIEALSTAPSFTDTSPNLMGQMAEIVGVM